MSRVLVAMSGGVDSSVAAALMLEAGHDVIGVTLKQWEGADGSMPTAGCCTVADAEDARRAAAQLGVPYYVLDYVDEFRHEVVDRFGEMYAAGRTPNPCVECNRRVRFRALLERTSDLGCDLLATGHHVRLRTDAGGRHHLHTATDAAKDQSYVLHMLGQQQLARVRFPVGEMTKAQVRSYADDLGLRTASKADSQDLCFVGNGDYRSFIREHFPDVARSGPMVDTRGREVGRHEGTIDFTVGQRRGLNVALGEPRYVVGLDAASATVIIGTKEELEVAGCVVGDVSWVAGQPPRRREVMVKVRYRSAPVEASLIEDGRGEWTVQFARHQRAVAPGQAAVFYRGDELLGGGTILTTVR